MPLVLSFILQPVYINIHNACIIEIRHPGNAKGLASTTTAERIENPRNIFMNVMKKGKLSNRITELLTKEPEELERTLSERRKCTLKYS